MKKKNFFSKLLIATMMGVPFMANAQVTIGSSDIPQATLDIRGNPNETGKAFRLTDGNQAPGKVLTAGENGIGTWQNSGITILQSTMPQPETAKSALIRDFSTTSTIFVDEDFYIDLDPGKYMIFTFVPIYFNFSIEAFERVSYRIVLTKDGISWDGLSIFINGPMRLNTLVRHLTMFPLTVPPSDTLTRYYVGYSELRLFNSNGINVSTNTTLNPNTSTNSASFIRNGTHGHVYAVPMK